MIELLEICLRQPIEKCWTTLTWKAQDFGLGKPMHLKANEAPGARPDFTLKLRANTACEDEASGPRVGVHSSPHCPEHRWH